MGFNSGFKGLKLAKPNALILGHQLVAKISYSRKESFFFFCLRCCGAPLGQGLLFHEIYRSQRRTTLGTTPLDEWSASRRDLYLTTHTTLTRDTHPCPRRN